MIGTAGKLIGVRSALLMNLVSSNCVVNAMISMMFASEQPAFGAAQNSSSETLPAVSIGGLANMIAAWRLESTDRPSRLIAILFSSTLARLRAI